MLLLKITFICGIAWTSGQECGTDRQRRCKSAVLEVLETQSSPASSKEDELHCRSIRQNLNCLVWQLTHCSVVEEESTGDVVDRGWKFMRSICDTYGGWWQNKCFQNDEFKLCENHYKSQSGGATCTDFDLFQECTMDVVDRNCDPEDKVLVGTYLLEKSGKLVWTCSSGPKKPTQRISGSSSVYSAAIAAEHPFVPQGCNARSTEEIRGCLDRYQFERDQSVGAREEEERHRRSCCSVWKYKRCVQNAYRAHCYDSREVEAYRAIDGIQHESQYRCKVHWIYTCSGTTKISAVSVMSTAVMALFTVYGRRHLLD